MAKKITGISQTNLMITAAVGAFIIIAGILFINSDKNKLAAPEEAKKSTYSVNEVGGGTREFKSDSWKLSFTFPSDWEVQETDSGIRLLSGGNTIMEMEPNFTGNVCEDDPECKTEEYLTYQGSTATKYEPAEFVGVAHYTFTESNLHVYVPGDNEDPRVQDVIGSITFIK